MTLPIAIQPEPPLMPPPAVTFYVRTGKRLFDLCASAAAILILAPVLLLLSSAVVLSSGLPVFFRQERTGLNGKPFRIWKFRTMRQMASPN